MKLIKKEVFDKLKLEEFFCIDIESTKKQFSDKLKQNSIKLVATEYDVEECDNFFAKSGIEIFEELAIAHTENVGAERFKVFVNLDAIVAEVKKSPHKFS